MCSGGRAATCANRVKQLTELNGITSKNVFCLLSERAAHVYDISDLLFERPRVFLHYLLLPRAASKLKLLNWRRGLNRTATSCSLPRARLAGPIYDSTSSTHQAFLFK